MLWFYMEMSTADNQPPFLTKTVNLSKLLITAIENTRFEIYLRFIWIQTYKIFLLLMEVIC